MISNIVYSLLSLPGFLSRSLSYSWLLSCLPPEICWTPWGPSACSLLPSSLRWGVSETPRRHRRWSLPIRPHQGPWSREQRRQSASLSIGICRAEWGAIKTNDSLASLWQKFMLAYSWIFFGGGTKYMDKFVCFWWVGSITIYRLNTGALLDIS